MPRNRDQAKATATETVRQFLAVAPKSLLFFAHQYVLNTKQYVWDAEDDGGSVVVFKYEKKRRAAGEFIKPTLAVEVRYRPGFDHYDVRMIDPDGHQIAKIVGLYSEHLANLQVMIDRPPASATHGSQTHENPRRSPRGNPDFRYEIPEPAPLLAREIRRNPAVTAEMKALAQYAKDPAMAQRLLRVAEAVDYKTAPPLTGPRDIVRFLTPLLGGLETEATVAVALNQRYAPIGTSVLARGSDAFTIVDPRAIFAWALSLKGPRTGTGAKAIVLAHNHPSGDPTPSPQDLDVTRVLASGGRILGIALLDHIVYADPERWVSLAERGELPQWEARTHFAADAPRKRWK